MLYIVYLVIVGTCNVCNNKKIARIISIQLKCIIAALVTLVIFKY